MSRILYDVPLIGQQTNQTCWYAAANMVVKYHRGQKRQSTIAGGAIGQPSASAVVHSGNHYIPWQLVESFAREQNFSVRHISPTPGGLVSLLEECGPLWYGGDWVNPTPTAASGSFASGHVIVIAGCETHGAGKATVYVNDPWPVPNGSKVDVDFQKLFSTLAAVGNVPFLYLPP